MSELISHLRRMLSQAQMFANDAPMEAVARAKLLVHEAHEGLAHVSEVERDEVLAILQLARKRVARYEQKLAAFQGTVEERAALFLKHEHERLQQSIPSKG
jgi:hypothetical protein